MASVFRLADVAQTGATIVDFKSGTLKAAGRTWQTGTPASTNAYRYSPFGAVRAFDHFNLRGERFQIVGSDTVANLLTAEKAIESALEAARRYHTDPMEELSWWLEVNANGEDARRTLIYDGSVEFLARPGADPHMTYGNMWGEVSLIRHPLWETTGTANTSDSALSCWGGKWTMATVQGTAPGRIASADFFGHTGGNDATITELWAGIREVYEGVANFNAVWDFGTGCTYTNNTVDSGTYATTTLSTAPTSMAKRITKTLHAHDSTDYDEYFGRYLVLLRCKVSAGVTAAVQIKKGFVDSHAMVANDPVYVTNTDYMLIDVGEVMIPPVGRWYGDAAGNILYFQIELWAELVTASGGTDYLYSDGICLIPSTHMLHANDIAINASNSGHHLYVITKPNDEDIVWQSSATGRDFGVDGSVRDWYFPTGGWMLILAAQRASSHDTSDELDTSFDYNARWLAYRKDA